MGVVVTDSTFSNQPRRFVSIGAFDGAENVIDGALYPGFGDLSNEGTTVDDYFVGMYSDQGIAGFLVQESPGSDFEIDHLQYGFSVPEPSSLVISLILGTAMFARHNAKGIV